MRNFAFLLAYSSSAASDLIVFLDDDILLTSSTYRGHHIPIDGVSLIRQLLSLTPPRQVIASGAGYLGRFDASILDHLRLHLNELEKGIFLCSAEPRSISRTRECLRQVSVFPTGLPVRLSLPGTRGFRGGPGISGALLATTPASLVSHPLPRCYSEDWIWLLLLGRPGFAVRKAGSRALHAAPSQVGIKRDFIVYQNNGEVVYRAVENTMKRAPDRCDALEWCEDRISSDDFLLARDSVAREIRSLLKTGLKIYGSIDRLGLILGDNDGCGPVRSALGSVLRYGTNALELVEALDPVSMHRWFREYLAQAPAWSALLKDSRQILHQAVRRADWSQ